MALVGYARVRSVGQSLAVQRETLAACDRIVEETRSGTVDARPRLTACLDYVRDGDTLVVTRLDRLARSTLHLCQRADQLRQKGVALRVLDQAIDTRDATGRLLLHMLGAIAQFETEIRAERQHVGIANALARGCAARAAACPHRRADRRVAGTTRTGRAREDVDGRV